MAAETAVLEAANEVVTKAAMVASLEQLTTPPKQLYLRGSRRWWGRDARRPDLDDSQVVWCRPARR